MGLWQITSGHLIATGHYRQIAVILVAGLVLNIAVNFLLIPGWSYRGAAVAKTGTTIGLALIGLVISRKKNLNRTLGVVVRGAVVLAFSAQTAYLLRNHPLIAVPAFLCIMGLSCLLLKLVTRQDYLRLKSLINVRPPCESP
jgi:O-antigen/teichoic acid export membrane protein